MSDRARLICFYELAAGDAWPLAGSSTAVAGMTQQQVWDWIGKNTYYGLPSATPGWPTCQPPAAAAGTGQRLDLQDPEECRGGQRVRARAKRREDAAWSAVDGPAVPDSVPRSAASNLTGRRR